METSAKDVNHFNCSCDFCYSAYVGHAYLPGVQESPVHTYLSQNSLPQD